MSLTPTAYGRIYMDIVPGSEQELLFLDNEPHLISPNGRQRWAPAAGDPSQVEFILGLTDKVPLTSGRDLVPGPRDGAVEIHPALELLEHDDPLYTARMHLGERRTLWGWGFIPLFFMFGPPGIDFFTYPELRNLSDYMAFWNIDPNDDELLTLYSNQLLMRFGYRACR